MVVLLLEYISYITYTKTFFYIWFKNYFSNLKHVQMGVCIYVCTCVILLKLKGGKYRQYFRPFKSSFIRFSGYYEQLFSRKAMSRCYLLVILNGISSQQRCFLRKGVLKFFANDTVNQLCQSLFFNKVAGPKLQASVTGVFL